MKVSLCLFTRNALSTLPEWFEAFETQDLSPIYSLAIDSASNDGTVKFLESAGFALYGIEAQQFDHGATRQLGNVLCSDADILIYMTQDAILAAPDALSNLLSAFDDPLVGAVYGRQLPRKFASPIEAHARFFNYPPTSRLKTVKDIPSMGIKTAFISNSFAAYRRSALVAVGGFPASCIVSEDTYVAAKMILGGWAVAYCPDALVYHSHKYTYVQEFQRYFDVGVFHARQPWILQAFGRAEGEGLRFIISEIKYLLHAIPFHLPSAFIRTFMKYFGFRLGNMERYLPLVIKKRFSMQKNFWRT